MSTGFTPTVSNEKAVLSGDLHSGLLNTFLLGMYTPLYFGTMYICITSKSSRGHIVLTATTILYVATAVSDIMEWLKLLLLIGACGESRIQILLSEAASVSGTIGVVLQVFGVLPFVVADGLLIWRCFKVWNNSLKVVAMPMILLFAETAIYIAATVFITIVSTEAESEISDHMTGAAFFITSAVTIWTTILIAYRIYCTSNLILNRRKSRFYSILEIIIQSSFLYSLALLPTALVEVIPLQQSNFAALNSAANYLNVILSGMTGMAPTIMVARIALSSNSDADIVLEPTTVGVSGIQFGEQNSDTNGQGVSHPATLQDSDKEA